MDRHEMQGSHEQGQGARALRTVGYLSGAPRVSTLPDAERTGPRAHVLGVISGLEGVGCRVRPFIVGDRVPRNWAAAGSEERLAGGFSRRLAADLVRFTLAKLNSRRAFRELAASVDWVYERNGAMQALGRRFQKAGKVWVLETNAPLFLESTSERKTVVLRSLTRWVEERAYRDCDLIVCVSDQLKQLIVEHVGIDEGKVLVLPNAVDTAVFDPALFPEARVGAQFTIGFLGTLWPWQGLDLLLSAVARHRREGRDIALLLVGSGPMKSALEARAAELGIGEAISFTGLVPREDVPRWLAAMDVGFSAPVAMNAGMYLSPIKIYEYMAMGCPVLAASSEDAERLIIDGENGFLFPSGDEGALYGAIGRAFDRRGELRRLGQRARQTIEGGHSWRARAEVLTEKVAEIHRLGPSAGRRGQVR